MMVEQSLEELAVEADHIFISRVQSVHSAWDADKTSIKTTVALSVEEYLKSTTFPRGFTLVLPGGTVGDVSLFVEGTPTFVAGEGVLLFLKDNGELNTLLVGGWQGVYHIEGSEAIQPEVNRRMPLSELRAHIRAATATVPPPAYGGAMMLKRSVGELTTEADRIIVADVLAIEPQFNADGSSINTKVTLAVDKVLKGKAKAQETLTLPGGHVGDYGVLVGGVPNFISGERVLLFLDDSSQFAIAGMWQGKYSLSGDEVFQPETGLKASVASLEQEISQALAAPVEIGTSPEVVHAQYQLWGNCAWDPNNDSNFPITHYVNPANAGSGAPTGASFVSLMYDSLYAWQNLSNSWALLWVAGTTTRDATDHFDGNNDIVWADLSGSTLGVNWCAYSGGYRIDSDTRFDNSDRTWTITAEAGRIDLRSVSEHELGHDIGLGHSDQFCDGTASTPLMCSYINAGVRKTILTDDSNGAAALYGLTGLPPNAPSGLSVTAADTTNNLSWTDNSGDELAFEIQRASGSCAGPFTGAATVPANTTTYTDDDYGVGLTGTYCYRVKALNRGGDSGFSNTALDALTIVKQTAINPVTTGQLLTYTIAVTNTGSITATNILITDTVPTSTTLDTNSLSMDATHSGTTPGSTITWTTNISLTTNESLSRTFVVTVDTGINNGSTIANTAHVSATNVSAVKSDTVATTVAAPVLAVTITPDPDPIEATTTLITYTITTENSGDADATEVTITNTIPSSTTYVTGSASNGGDETAPGSGVIAWPPTTVNTNSSITRSFQVSVSAAITDGDRLINTISANSAQDINIENSTHAETVGEQRIYLPIILKSFTG